ncbi:caspase family protein [Streptomyces sp. NPDC096934]|uniref:caspase, EACC1-associated type n=1 Tax=Streptomyces sp. NPDC096934 TaxID=3155551 RepID=UPI003332E3A4
MALPRPEDSRAIFIGISDYTQLPGLPTVRNNIETLRRIFSSAASWNLAPDHCTVVHNPRTPEELVDPIQRGAEEATDTLLVYYAGHGLKGENRGELRLTRSTSRTGAPQTSTDYNEIRETLLGSDASRRILILDCCYAASALGTMSDPANSIADDALIEGTYLIAAAGETESAMAEDGRGFTVFTGELIRLLSEGIPDSSKELLDLDVIYDHLHSVLRAKSRPLPHRRARNSLGKLALARNPFWRPTAVNNSVGIGELSPSTTAALSNALSHSSTTYQVAEFDGIKQSNNQNPSPSSWPAVTPIGYGRTRGDTPSRPCSPESLSRTKPWDSPHTLHSNEPPQSIPQDIRNELELVWNAILEKIKARRRFAWIILTQNSRIASFDGITMHLAFDNEAARSAYLSNGLDEVVNTVIRDDLGYPWIVSVSDDIGTKPKGEIKNSPSPRKSRPGEWPASLRIPGAARDAAGSKEEAQKPITWPTARKPPPPENFERIQELWPRVLKELEKHRRYAWFLSIQYARPVKTEGTKILLGFTNETYRLAFISNGISEILEKVATEVLRFECSIEPVLISE